MRRKFATEELQDLRERAISLRLEGHRPKAIAKILGSGHSPGTVSRWLKKSNRIPSSRDWAISLYDQGLSVEEIGKRIGVQKSQVWKILRDYRGKLRSRNTPEQNVEIFLADPAGSMTQRFVRSGPFGWTLLKRLSLAVSDDPLKSRDAVLQSIELFKFLKEVRRNPEAKREAACLLLAAIGLDAHIDSVTVDPQLGLAKLEDACGLVDSCRACEAEFLRLLGLAYAHLGFFNAALSFVSKARARYKALSTPGHCLLGNGLGACSLARAAIRNLSEGPGVAASDAREGLKITSPKESPFLYSVLVLNLARYLKGSDDAGQIHEARLLLDRCMAFFSVDEPCRGRLYTRWLDGNLAQLEGHPRDAQIILRHALKDAQQLKLESEVAAIIADIGAIDSAAERMINEVEGMLIWDWTADSKVLPLWIRSGIREAMDALYRSAKKSAKCAERAGRKIEMATLEALRDAAESASNGKVLPAFVL